MKDDHWIITFTGNRFWPLSPEVDHVDIRDIAHALSNLCRFTGHCNRFYSVAEHSVLVSINCSPENALWGLLHDAAEAYIGDMSRPLKRQPEFSAKFRDVEHNLMAIICEKFELPKEMPEEVRIIDGRMLATEKEQITTPTKFEWTDIQGTSVPLPEYINGWEPRVARCYFLTRFEKLWADKKLSKSAKS